MVAGNNGQGGEEGTPVDRRSLQNLSPAERIKALKKIEERRKRQIAAAEALIKESEREIEVAETVRKIPLPQMRSIDPSTLFSHEEHEIFATHHQTHQHAESGLEQATGGAQPPQRKAGGEGGSESLEETVAGERTATEHQRAGAQYNEQLEKALGAAYRSLTQMAERVDEKGYINASEEKALDMYKSRIEEIHDQLGSHPERNDKGVMGMVYSGLDAISHMQERLGYAHKGAQGGGGGPGGRYHHH